MPLNLSSIFPDVGVDPNAPPSIIPNADPTQAITQPITPEVTLPPEEEESLFSALGEGFANGVVDAGTLGIADKPFASAELGLNARFAGEVAGSIVAEIPYWMVGVGAYRRAVQGGGALLKATKALRALETSEKFGMRVISKVAKPEIAGDVLSSIAVQGARTGVNIAQGEEVGAADAVAVGIAATMPFIPAFNQARKAVRGSVPSHPIALKFSMDEKSVRDAFVDDDYFAIAALDETWTPTARTDEGVESMMELYDKGAPIADIYAIHNRADVTNYGVNGTFNPSLAKSRADNPEGRALMGQHLTAPALDLPVPSQAGSTLDTLPMNEPVGRLGGDGFLASDIESALPSMYTTPLVKGPEGWGKTGYDYGINNIAPLRRVISSIDRSLSAMGENGKQLTSLLGRARIDHQTSGAGRISAVNNEMEGIKADPKALKDVVRYFTDNFLDPQTKARLETIPAVKAIREVRNEMNNQFEQIGILEDSPLYVPSLNPEVEGNFMLDPLNRPIVAAQLRTAPSQFIKFRLVDVKEKDLYHETLNSLTRWVDDNSKRLADAKALGNPNALYSFNEVGPWAEFIPLQKNIKAWINVWENATPGKGGVLVDRMLDTAKSMSPHQLYEAALRANVKGLGKGKDAFLTSAHGKDPITLIGDLFGVTKAEDLTVDQVAHVFMVQRMSDEGLHSVGGAASALIKGIAEDGYDARYAREALRGFQGLSAPDPNMLKFSKAMRDYNIITKLGTAVIENAGQLAFTATKFGIRNTLKAFKEFGLHMGATKENARMAGALSDGVIRSLEVESGKSVVGKFLQGTGFTAVENMNVSVSALAGQIHFRDQFMKIAKGDQAATKLMKRYGWDTGQWINDAGELTNKGAAIFRGLDSGKGSIELGAFEKVAALKAVRETQVFSDMLDNPIYQLHPMGKMMGQFKTFATGSVRFAKAAIYDELKAGNPRPMLRALLAGVTVGEVTQDLRAIVSGNDWKKRGQEGTFRDQIGKMLADNDETVMKLAAQRMSVSDVLGRTVENILGIGFAGIAGSMLESSMRAGKVGAANIALGPTGSLVAEVIGGAGDILQGSAPQGLLRKVQREGSAAIGALPGVRNIPGAPFATTMTGRQSQVALNPSPFQTEQSLYQTPDESAAIGLRQVVTEYNLVRGRAEELMTGGDMEGAIEEMRRWNGGIQDKMESLREVGALNAASAAKITFSGGDARNIRKRIAEKAREGGVFGKARERIGSAFGG